MFICSWVWHWLLGWKNGWCGMIAVFDLDGTVLDSSHRALINDDGGINIKEWRTHTAEQILKDSELPLADYMRFCIASPKIRTWICTSRHLQNADRLLLQRLGLYDVDLILSRDENDNREDVPYKLAKVGKYLNLPNVKKMAKLFFDDREDIRKAMKQKGFDCPSPHYWNYYQSR